jgi:hypothetical protein
VGAHDFALSWQNYSGVARTNAGAPRQTRHEITTNHDAPMRQSDESGDAT